jgi:hypothetical protein
MNTLYLEATQDTPKVLLNKRDGIFEISGKSLPEDSEGFYDSVIKWVKDYAKEPNESTVFAFKLKYFNSASSKYIYDMLDTLKGIKGAQVEWSYHKNDEDILDAGKEFEEELEFPFSYKQI